MFRPSFLAKEETKELKLTKSTNIRAGSTKRECSDRRLLHSMSGLSRYQPSPFNQQRQCDNVIIDTFISGQSQLEGQHLSPQKQPQLSSQLHPAGGSCEVYSGIVVEDFADLQHVVRCGCSRGVSQRGLCSAESAHHRDGEVVPSGA